MEVAPGVYSMSQQQGGHVHAFLLDDGNGLTLIDTLYDDDANVVLAELKRIGKTPADLKHIILSHGHKSHVGRRTATRVSPIPRRPLQVYGLQLGLALGLGRHNPCEVDRRLKAGDRVGPLEVMESPGHTPGSLTFWWAEKRALFAGDVIATWPELAPGWPGLTLDNDQNLRSARQLTDFGNAEILGVGHGEPIAHDAAAEIKKAVK
jgi:glyoxylase-like metal-dependent hydrolase (beta-lactamase superfamily II)